MLAGKRSLNQVFSILAAEPHFQICLRWILNKEPTLRDDDGRAVQNLILLELRKEWPKLFPKLDFVEMKLRDVLVDVGEPIRSAYFINSGLASSLTVMMNGKSVEVGLLGKEGFIGLPLVVGLETSATRIVVQIAGTAFRMRASNLVGVLQEYPHLERKLNRYTQSLGTQATQVAACNRMHEVEERLARWLLMSQDRIGGKVIPLSHEFLAQMLGTRRSSVTIAARNLQRGGSITHTRGEMKIVNRIRLENAACECYEALTKQDQKWKGESSGNAGLL
jgi:CRP-like cAMP-binding protein